MFVSSVDIFSLFNASCTMGTLFIITMSMCGPMQGAARVQFKCTYGSCRHWLTVFSPQNSEITKNLEL